MADRPGVMIYFDLKESLADYSAEEAGQLFLAILEYGTTGVLPEFSDRGMKTLWKSIQPKIDRDNAKYHEVILKRKYAVFVREYEKTHGKDTAASFDTWKEQMISHDIQPQPQQQLQPQPQPQLQIAEGIQGGSLSPEEFDRRRSEGIDAITKGKGILPLSVQDMNYWNRGQYE